MSEFDLSSIDTVADSERGTEIELINPYTGDALGQFICVTGKHGKTFRQHQRDLQNVEYKKAFEASRKGKKVAEKTVEEQDKSDVELLVACTTGFRNLNFNGPLSFSPEAARKLYTERLWIREQVDIAVGKLENFTKS